jgi:hypothetical protein
MSSRDEEVMRFRQRISILDSLLIYLFVLKDECSDLLECDSVVRVVVSDVSKDHAFMCRDKQFL